MDLSVKEHIEYIDSSLQLIVSDAHTFGTDALLLAAFASPKRQQKVCDFGTGCGIIPFYWLSHGVEKVNAVEIQTQACEQLNRSIKLNCLENRFNLIWGDLKELKGKLPFGEFDVVTMNPPYTAIGKGIISSSKADKTARHETDLTLDSLCESAAKLLKFGGKFCICLRPERLTEAFVAMKNAKIEPKRLRFVTQRTGKAPWLFLLEGKRGRNSGITVEKELLIENEDGTPSDEMLEILGNYRKNGEYI